MPEEVDLRKLPLRERWKNLQRRNDRAASKERAGFVEPTSAEEGRAQLLALRAEIEIIKGDIQGTTAEEFPDESSFKTWRASATIRLSRMKARLILLQDWLAQQKGVSDATKIAATVAPPDLSEPATIEAAEAERDKLVAEVMAIQAEISVRKNSRSMPPQEFGEWKAGQVAVMQPKQQRIKFLGSLLKQARQKRDSNAQRNILDSADNVNPEDPNSLLAYGTRMFSRVLKRNSVILAEEDGQLMTVIKDYLVKNGYWHN